ncbi:MAG: 5'/3'-nucleotidase SurE [Pseudomonadota bacterium]
MRILITNDDGINAPGLAAAEAIAAALTPDTEPEIWVVAPAVEQSAVGHSVAYVRPMRVDELGPRRFAVEGSPADCALVALTQLMRDTPPDLVLSGVNRGFNVAEDVVYSGTVAGAREACMQGARAIALSQAYGPGNLSLADPFEAAIAYGPKVIQALLAHGTFRTSAHGPFYNINFPARPSGQVAGIRAAAQGLRPAPSFKVVPYQAPNRRDYYWLTHAAETAAEGNAGSADGTDAKLLSEGYVTATALTAQMTATEAMEVLAHALDEL